VGGNLEQPDGQIPEHDDEDQEQKRANPRCIQHLAHDTYDLWALRFGHASLPAFVIIRPQINPLDNYCPPRFITRMARNVAPTALGRPSAPHPEEPRSGVSKDAGPSVASWFETREDALLTMRG